MSEMMTGKGRRARVLYFAAGFCALIVAGCSRKSLEESADAPVKAEVTLTRVTRADISERLALTGTAAAPPNADVRVSALVPGRIAELTVAEGDTVKAGQVVAKLDDRTYRGLLQQAQAGEQQAKANLENAQLSRTRDEDLLGRGIVARKDVEDARTQESVAAAGMEQAEAALELARLQVTRTVITSPINGAVAKRFVSVGEQVDGTAAQSIVEIANLNELEFLANAPAMYLAKLRPGEPVEATTEAAPGKKFPGHVLAVSPAVDPATGVGLVRIRVPNPGGLLRLGVFLEAEVPVQMHAHAVCVPLEAIYHDETGAARIYIVNQNSATAVPVKVGIETTDLAELLDPMGVKEGDQIILTGGYGLGEKVQIQAATETKQ